MKTTAHSLYFRALENRGQVFDLIGEFPKATKDYSKIKTLYKNSKADICAYLGIGQANMKSGKFHDALEQADSAYNISRKKALHYESVRSLILKSQILVRMGQFDDAMKCAKESRRLLAQALKTRKKEFRQLLDLEDARVMSLMALVHCMKCNYKKAIPLLKKSAAKFKKHHNIWNVAVNQLNLGNVYCETGVFDKAISCYESSLRIKQKIGDKYGIANSLHNISRVFGMRGQHNIALDRAQQALHISESIHDISGIGSAHLAIGIHLRNLGRFREALSAYHESKRIYRKQHEPYVEIANLINIAMVHLLQGNYQRSKRLLDEIEKQARVLKNPYLLVSTLNLKANYYYRKSRPLMVQKTLRECIDLCREYDLANEEIQALSHRVRAITRWPKIVRREFANASVLLRRVWSMERKVKSIDALVTILPAQIDYSLAHSDYKKAREYAKKFIALARKTKNAGLLPHAYYQLARVMQMSGQNASDMFTKAKDMAKAVGVKLHN